MNNSIKDIEIKDPQAVYEVIKELKESQQVLKDIFGRQKTNVEKVNETEIWSGDAAQAFYRKYSMLNNNYNEIEYSVDLYIKYLEKVMEDYRLAGQAISKNIDEMAENLTVNG